MPIKDPEKRRVNGREAQRRYTKRHRKRVREAMRRYRARHPETVGKYNRILHLRRKFKITEADYQTLLEKQNGRCAVCPRLASEERYGRLHIDHDHINNRIRGLLCQRHNMVLGLVKDNVNTLKELIEYLHVDNLRCEPNLFELHEKRSLRSDLGGTDRQRKDHSLFDGSLS